MSVTIENDKKILIELDSFDRIIKLIKICSNYNMDIDIVHGRYVSGCSFLSAVSLIRKTVEIRPITENDELINKFIDDMKNIGAWCENEIKE